MTVFCSLLQLKGYAEQIDKQRKEGCTVYVAIISGGPNAVMAKNALELQRQIHMLRSEPPPKAPRQVKSIASFFGKKSA